MRIAFWGGVRGYVYSLSLLRFCSGGVRVYFLITSTLTSFVLCFFTGAVCGYFQLLLLLRGFLFAAGVHGFFLQLLRVFVFSWGWRARLIFN